MEKRFSLRGKSALVTGAAQGIGFETAKRLAQRGASVAVLDLDLEAARAATERMGPESLALAADVTDARAMEEATASASERFGGLDVVVANAGIAPPPSPMSAVDPDAFERVVDVDLYGVWRTVRPALPDVIARRGHVVVVASVYAFMNGVMAAPYAAAKAGVEALGRSLRTELAHHGASAGVAYFGFIDTQMVRDAFADRDIQTLEERLPSFVTRRLTPDVAGRTIVDGIERRAPRMIAPRWWAAYSALRGIANPVFDRLLAGDEIVAKAVRDAESKTQA